MQRHTMFFNALKFITPKGPVADSRSDGWEFDVYSCARILFAPVFSVGYGWNRKRDAG